MHNKVVNSAIAEVGQELGAKLIYLSELIVPKVYRHVSYTDEVSKIYLAVAEHIGSQLLDVNENISVDIIPLKEVKKAFKSYLNGNETDFFGFDISDSTMLSMSLFFWKLDSGELDLNNLNPNSNLMK